MKVEVNTRDGFKLVRAAQPIGSGEVVLRLSDSTLLGNPSRESIKVGAGQHAEHPVGSFVNHSCNPSCVVVGDAIRALVDLAAGDEITFDYTANEEALASPFTCLDCGKLLTGSPPPCRNRVDAHGPPE